jgi:cell division protein FtsB
MKVPSSRALRHKLVALSLLWLLFFGSSGLYAVWVRQEISRTANRNKTLERKAADLDRRLDAVATAIAMAGSPEALLAQNNRMRLGLVRPSEEQVQRIEVSPELLLVAKRNQESVALTAPRLAFRVTTVAPAR